MTTNRLTINVPLDGVSTPIHYNFSHWLPKLLRVDGTTLGTRVYFTKPFEQVNIRLVAHETIHSLVFFRLQQKVPFNSYFLTMCAYLFNYFFQYVRAGFSYYNIAEEKFAYGNEHLVAMNIFDGVDFQPVIEQWSFKSVNLT